MINEGWENNPAKILKYIQNYDKLYLTKTMKLNIVIDNI